MNAQPDTELGYIPTPGMTYVRHIPPNSCSQDVAIQVLTDLELETLRTALDLHEEGLQDAHTQAPDEHRLRSWEQLLEAANDIQNQITAVRALRIKFGFKKEVTNNGNNGDVH